MTEAETALPSPLANDGPCLMPQPFVKHPRYNLGANTMEHIIQRNNLYIGIWSVNGLTRHQGQRNGTGNSEPTLLDESRQQGLWLSDLLTSQHVSPLSSRCLRTGGTCRQRPHQTLMMMGN